MMDCEQQRDWISCTLYAIAIATALSFSINPAELRFDVSHIRPHLTEYLLSGSISPFPSAGHRVCPQKRPNKIFSFALYCICRLPDGDAKFEKCKIMAQWKNCTNYYHQHCLHIPQRFIDSRKRSWLCFNCA